MGTSCLHEDKASPPNANTSNQVETNNKNNDSSNSSSSSSEEENNDENLVIKTENKASEKEANEMLEEVDRQLDSLLKALDEMGTMDVNELPDEEGE